MMKEKKCGFSMVKEYRIGLMDHIMMVNGMKVLSMEKVKLHTLMKIYMKDNTLWVRPMDSANTSRKKAKRMKVNGETIIQMAKVYNFLTMDAHMKVNF